MKRTENTKPWVWGALLASAAFIMAILLTQTPAWAVTCSPSMPTDTDYDNDGFTDYQECYGITLHDGTCICGSVGCCGQQISPPSDRAVRLDPDTEDLFVILVQTSPSLFPTNPLQYVSNPISQGGLGIATHVITPTAQYPYSDRTVSSSSTQKAVRVTESSDATNDNLLGFCNTGTPNGLDLTTIYTVKIQNFLISVYGTLEAVPLEVKNNYIRHTIAHEVAHTLGPLAPAYNANFGGYHYKSGTNVIMDQSIYYTSKKGTVTFYIGTTYTSADEAGVILK